MLRWYAIAKQYREQLAETNLALVLAMAKRVRLSEVDFADLIGEGNMALMRSVDKFDCGRGFKFSTYACRAILKSFSRHGIKVTTQKKRFGAEFDPTFEKSNHLEVVRATHERECADEVKHIVVANKAEPVRHRDQGDHSSLWARCIARSRSRRGREHSRHLHRDSHFGAGRPGHRRHQGTRAPDPKQGAREDSLGAEGCQSNGRR